MKTVVFHSLHHSSTGMTRKIVDSTFALKRKKAAEPEPDMDESTQRLIQLLQTSPELAGTLLQFSSMLQDN